MRSQFGRPFQTATFPTPFSSLEASAHGCHRAALTRGLHKRSQSSIAIIIFVEKVKRSAGFLLLETMRNISIEQAQTYCTVVDRKRERTFRGKTSPHHVGAASFRKPPKVYMLGGHPFFLQRQLSARVEASHENVNLHDVLSRNVPRSTLGGDEGEKFGEKGDEPGKTLHVGVPDNPEKRNIPRLILTAEKSMR